MVSTDPISDMLTRIRNAKLVNRSHVSVPHSKIKESLAKLLAENNFIDKVEIDKDGFRGNIKITINDEDSTCRITEINRVSKPGRRHYVSVTDIPVVKGGRGIVILSTAKGLLSGREAKKHNVGGEVICEVY